MTGPSPTPHHANANPVTIETPRATSPKSLRLEILMCVADAYDQSHRLERQPGTGSESNIRTPRNIRDRNGGLQFGALLGSAFSPCQYVLKSDDTETSKLVLMIAETRYPPPLSEYPCSPESTC